MYSINPPLNWKANLTRAKRLLRRITINAQKHRSEFLAQRQLEALQTPSSKDAEVLKRIIKAEEKRLIFQRFARYICPRNDNTMNYLEIPENDADPKHPDTTRSQVNDIDQMNSL